MGDGKTYSHNYGLSLCIHSLLPLDLFWERESGGRERERENTLPSIKNDFQ